MSDTMRRLANRMLHSRTIAFVGAGASASVGYPTWDQLLDGLYQEAELTKGVRPPSGDEDLRWVAEQFDTAMEGTLVDAVRRVFESHSPGGPGPVHTMLARLPFNHYITTNYDRLIEQACSKDVEDSAQWLAVDQEDPQLIAEPCIPRSGRDQEQFSGFLSLMAEDSPRRAVLHLHGTLEDRLTLTMSDFNRQYLHDATLLRMFAVFATSTVVFIGASMRDADVMELVRRAHFHSGPKPRHFTFLPDSRLSEAALLERNYGIQSIFYKYDSNEGHGDVVRRLEQLLELVEEQKPYPAALRPKGNLRSTTKLLASGQQSSFEDQVDRVKDEVRRRRMGLATFSGLDPVTSSRILRRIAIDYARLPGNHHFQNVIWLSPGNLGSFPGPSGSRTLIDSLVGELTSALGSYRLTAVPDHDHNFRAIERLLQRERGGRPESALIVIDAIEDLKDACDPTELQLLRWFLGNLPQGSVALLCQEVDADPFEDDRPWEGIKSHVVLDSDSTAQARAMSTRLNLEERIFEVLENDDVRHRVLLATCILASPVDCNMLTTMLDLPRLKVEGAVAELADSGLLELENLLDPPRLGDAGRARERVPKSGLGEIGITSPVRRAALSGGSELFGSSAGTLSYGVLTDVVWQLVSWSRSQIASLDRWEADKDQFRELVDSLADLLGVFEAGSWLMELHSQDISGLDSRFLDTWLWLGADLAYILPYAGRWAESKRIVQYLEKHIDKAHHPRDFRREMQILESRVVGHLAVRPEEVRQAADLALAAVASAEQDIAGLDSETSPRDRSALEFHLARARIRLGQTLLLEEKYVEARDQFAAVYEDAFSNGHGRVRGRRLKYAADAAGWLADVMGKTLPAQPSDDEVAEILRVLDDGFTALVELSNRRDRGQQAVLRGEVLIRHRNITGARRSLARALVISHEFQDRYLEARSLLGLASTDGRRSLAEKAASIFADVAPDLQRAAKELFYSLPPIEPDPLEASSKRPSVVLFMGLPGTGKTAALRTAKLVLTSWGMTPQIEGSTSSLIERMKRAEDPDFDEIRHRLVAIADETRRLRGGVVLARVPLADPGELFGDWDESDRLVEESLCVHLTAPSEILESRNRQRHAEGVDYSKLSESVPADGGEQRSSWASWVEVSGGAYVELRSDIPIRDFQESVTDALALSFLEVEPLLAQRL